MISAVFEKRYLFLNRRYTIVITGIKNREWYEKADLKSNLAAANTAAVNPQPVHSIPNNSLIGHW